MHNVLIIDDDRELCLLIKRSVLLEDIEADFCNTGKAGLQKLKEKEYQLVILDVMMPGISGYKTCEEIRKKSNVPVLFLTAKDLESDKLLGLMAGGDDYLVKPFSYAELLARVKALLRRHLVYDKAAEKKTEIEIQEEWIENKNIRINTEKNSVYLDEKEINLTEMEYKILVLLMKNPGKIFSVQNIYESIWEAPYLYSSGNTVMVHIRRLRKKIEKDPQNPKLIVSTWGKGYHFEKNK
mgnify:CR=1 FL=1